MRVVKHIDVEVNACSECPYYSDFTDMGAIMCVCEKIESDDFYERLLSGGDDNWQTLMHKISDKCPYKNFEY